ncbi:hypothetical protein DL96DRAFT_1556670 [Flagelloscypha sp. PMI_526]|nr:hypothetical protein DL96DRAFT_1556670 [Flagelloscypha sp. PMI_526]
MQDLVLRKAVSAEKCCWNQLGRHRIQQTVGWLVSASREERNWSDLPEWKDQRVCAKSLWASIRDRGQLLCSIEYGSDEAGAGDTYSDDREHERRKQDGKLHPDASCERMYRRAIKNGHPINLKFPNCSGLAERKQRLLPYLVLLLSAMSNPCTQQAGPRSQSPCPPIDVDMLDGPGEQEHNPSASTSNTSADEEADSNPIDFDDDPPRLDRETFGQSSAPDFNFNFLDDIYPTVWLLEKLTLSPYAEETGIPTEDVFEDRAFILLNTLNESDTRPNYAIYDDQRKLQAELPLFSGEIMTMVILPLLAHVQTTRNSLSVPNADDYETLFGRNDWLDRFRNEQAVCRYAVEYTYEWSILQEIELFAKDQEHMTLENINIFGLPHNPGYIYLAGTAEELEALESYISQLPLVCATAEPISAEEVESELAFPPAPDAYDLHPRDGEWVTVVRGLHADDFGYVRQFHPPNGSTRPYPVVEVIVIPRVCSTCHSNPAAPGRIDCVCRIRRPEPLLLKRDNEGSINTTSFEHLFEHSKYPWGIEPLSGLRRLVLPASHIVHSPYISPSIWVQFLQPLRVLSGISAFNHPLTPEQLFPLFHTVVVEQDEYTSFHCLIVSSPFLDDGAEPHDLSFKLISADSLPNHHVPSHLVNNVYISKFSTLSSAIDVGSTVKLRCGGFSDTFSVVRAEDSGRLVLRPTKMFESTFLLCIRNVEALIVVDGPVYKRQCQLLAHVPPLFIPTKADEDININSSFHPFSNWHDLRVCILPVVQPVNDLRLHYKGRQGFVKGVRTTRNWDPVFPSGLMVIVGIDNTAQLVRCDLFDLALELSTYGGAFFSRHAVSYLVFRHQWSWLSDSKHRELENTRGFFWNLLGYRPPPDVGILPVEIPPTPTREPERDMPAAFRPDGFFLAPPRPIGVEDRTPSELDVLRHPHLEGRQIMFSLISPPSSATKKERDGSLQGLIVNVDGMHYVRYQPGRLEGVTKDAPLRSIASLTPVGSPEQRATMIRRQVRLLDWRSEHFGQAFVIVGADDIAIPFQDRFVYVVAAEVLEDMDTMLDTHLFRVLGVKLVPFGDMKDRDGGNPEVVKDYRNHISTLQKRSAHSLHYLKTL